MLLFGISHLYICRYKDRKLRRYRIAVVASVFFVIFEKVIIIITVVNMALKVGDKIPEILGVNQYGEEVKAKDLAGKKLVLYFYILYIYCIHQIIHLHLHLIKLQLHVFLLL